MLESRAETLATALDSIAEQVKTKILSCMQNEVGKLSLQELRTIEIIGPKQSCIMREISEALGLALSTTTNLIDKLENKQLVQRKRSEKDRRIVHVCLTEKGTNLFSQKWENQLSVCRTILTTLDETTQAEFVKIMGHISKQFSQAFSEAQRKPDTVSPILKNGSTKSSGAV